MKNVLLATMLSAAASCNLIPPDSQPTQPTLLPPPVARTTDLRTSELHEKSTARLSEIDLVDANFRAEDAADTAVLHSAEMAPLLSEWAAASAQYRHILRGYLLEKDPADSIRQQQMQRVDSIGAVVNVRRTAMEAALQRAELGNIEAKLPAGASFKYQGGRYSAIKVDPKTLDIHLHWKDNGGAKYLDIDHLKRELEQKGQQVVMITNAGMYNPDNSPQGLYIEKGKQSVPLDTTRGPGGPTMNFYLKPNGVFYLDGQGAHVVTTEKFPAARKGIQFATQSGPMLVIDGQVHPKFNKGSANTNIRSGVGITPDGQVVFAISDRPVNFYDFAVLFRDAFHCPNALYLDGAISLMYLPNSRRMDLGGHFGPILAVTKK